MIFLLLILEGVTESGGSKGLKTYSNKLRPTVTYQKTVADIFDKKLRASMLQLCNQ